MTCALIGVGLIGGSLSLRLKQLGKVTHVLGVDKDPKHLQQAFQRGLIDAERELAQAVEESELIILAVPVDASLTLLPKILDLCTEKHTVIDVGSTKEKICSVVRTHPNRRRYVAFHPMWGTENSGPEFATTQSFEGRAGVICDAEYSAHDALLLTKELTKELGMHLLYMGSREHDIHTAYISHISHVTSYALANTVLEKEQEEETIFQLASSGFSSTVRLAKSHGAMWVPILMQNRTNVLEVLGEHIHQLQLFQRALEKCDKIALEELIEKANAIRAVLDHKPLR